MEVNKDTVIQALNEWKLAEHQYDFIIGDMIDYQVFDINAKRSRYESLLKMFKEVEE